MMYISLSCAHIKAVQLQSELAIRKHNVFHPRMSDLQASRDLNEEFLERILIEETENERYNPNLDRSCIIQNLNLAELQATIIFEIQGGNFLKRNTQPIMYSNPRVQKKKRAQNIEEYLS